MNRIRGLIVAGLCAISWPAAVADAAAPETQVVGGEPVSIGNVPWQVAVAEHQRLHDGYQSAFDRHFCGGSLVAPRLVVTAAHCLYDTGTTYFPIFGCLTDGGYAFGAEEFSVITGRTTLSADEGMEISVEEVWYFVAGPAGEPRLEAQSDPSGSAPMFNCAEWTWDVALLELARRSRSEPIRIAGPGERSAWNAEAPATVAGWGHQSDLGEKSDALRQAWVPIVGDEYCSSALGYGPRFMPATMLCAGPLQGGADACSFDSGGSLVVPVAGRGFRLVGSVSFGLGCAKPTKPGVYARIADKPIRPAVGAAVRKLAGVDAVGKAKRRPASRSG